MAAPFAIQVIAGGAFHDAIPVLRIQALTLVTAFLLATWNFGLLSLKRFREIMLADLVSATVSIAGTIVLGRAYGAQGAAVAVVAAEGAVAVASLRFLAKAVRGFAPQLGVVPKVVLAAAAGAGIAIALPDWSSAVLAAVTGLVYVGLVVVTRALPPELIGFARSAVARLRPTGPQP